MAIELVKAYKNNKIAGPEDVTHLMPKLLNLPPIKKKEEKKNLANIITLLTPPL